jgi:hypothetical protein
MRSNTAKESGFLPAMGSNRFTWIMLTEAAKHTSKAYQQSRSQSGQVAVFAAVKAYQGSGNDCERQSQRDFGPYNCNRHIGPNGGF